MKTLVIIRHGKSSWENSSLSDRQRPLLPKGIRRTEKVGNFLKEAKVHADVFISSPAKRAKQTADIIAEILGYNLPDILLEEGFYFTGANTIKRVIQNFDNQWNSVFIFGHNPDFTALSQNFVTERDFFYLPTTGTVLLQFDTGEWKKISAENCIRQKIIYPRDL